MKTTPSTDEQQGNGRKESFANQDQAVETESHTDIENQTRDTQQPRTWWEENSCLVLKGLFWFLVVAVIAIIVIYLGFVIWASTNPWGP